MPKPFSLVSAVFIASLGLSVGAQADGHGPDPAVGARQAQFQLLAFNIGILGNMARGNSEYDADMALAAAANIAAVASLDQRFHWVPGTDNASIEGTRALPAIWENVDDVIRIWGELGTTSAALAQVAGDGLDPMRAALGPVGAACGACHDDYRAPR